MLDVWFEERHDARTTVKWSTDNGDPTDDIYIEVRTSFGEWAKLGHYNDMLDHLLNEWVLSSTEQHYRLQPDLCTWVYMDDSLFEGIRDKVIDLVRTRELQEVTAKFEELTSKGE